MCRIAAYAGPEIPLENIVVRPRHSLLAQSQHAAEAKLAVNGDGFGVAWYDRDQMPGLYRDVLPAWGDDNLLSLCRMVRSSLFLAHVRASTVGETVRVNCHPFTHGKWSFCHNGQIPHFADVRRRLEADLPDALYHARRGGTDSELIFLTLLANGLDEDPEVALRRVIDKIVPKDGAAPVKLTCVFSDGARLYGFRHATQGPPPTLYLSGTLDNQGRALASEPLCGVAERWEALPADTLVSIDRTQGVARAA